MKKLKIAVIGAGSSYTPELIEGFIKRKETLPVASFYFMDIDREKMDIVIGLAKRMIETAGLRPKIVLTDNLDEAVEGADFVLGQIRVGKLEARILDEKIPLEFGLIGQETTGIGGMIKAFRTIPVILDIVDAIKRLAPDAWFINFSNPSGLVAEAVINHTGVKMMGLCNSPINMIMAARKRLPEGTRDFEYDFVGLNHLCWISAIYADGKEILAEQLTHKSSMPTHANLPESHYEDDLMRATGAIPTGYLNYFFYPGKQLDYLKTCEKSRGEVCKDIESDLMDLYKDTKLREKPEILNKRGGAMYSEAAVSLVDAIVNDKNEVHVVDVQNMGAFDWMHDDDVVEVKCRIGRNGATPIKLDGFDNDYIKGMMQVIKAYEKLAAKAAIMGDRDAALAAALVNPIIRDYDQAKPALEKMLEVNKEYLPQFFNHA